MSALALDSHDTKRSEPSTASGTSELSKFVLWAEGTVATADHVEPLKSE
jgi:hypothetical protein